MLVEIPIQVHPIPIYAKGIGFQPFAGGAQSVAESDESSYIPFKGPFSFAPLYPVYLESPKNLIVSDETILTPVSEPTPAIKTTTNLKTSQTKQPFNGGIKSEELQQQPFIVVTSTTTTEETTKKTITTPAAGETTTTTTITEERTTITKEEEDKITEVMNNTKENTKEVSELNKTESEIKEKPLEQIIVKEESLPETVNITKEEKLPNGGTKTTIIEEKGLNQNGDESDVVRKSVVETEAYELNNDDGSTVSIQKTTTTTTELTSTTPTVVINGEHYNDLNNGQQEENTQNEVNEQENKNTKNKENNGILDNQQMDVSMSG